MSLPALLVFLFTVASFSLFGQDGRRAAGGNLVLFGRGLYPGDDSSFDLIRHSGFTTLMLSSFYIRSDGDVYSGDDSHHPIIHQGVFTGSESWAKRVRALRKHGSPIRRIEILLEGRWYHQPPNTYDFIRDWIDGGATEPGVIPGTKTGSTLYTIARILKEEIGADAICIDDESVYDSTSIIQLGKMLQRIGLRMTICPYTNIPYWKKIVDSSSRAVVDAAYLQCYDGGAHATPGPWAEGLQHTIPVYPIFLCRGAFSTCGSSHNSKTPEEISAMMRAFRKEYPGMSGAGIWQMQDVKSYVHMDCAVQDPASGNAKSVEEYLEQLRRSLGEGL